jgi:predicted nuclease of predicted toxin-antitoxin system
MLDAGVPVSVGRVFEELGHEVLYYNDVLAEKAADIVVCATALQNKAILVAFDNDMKQIARKDDRFARLSLIKFHCEEHQAANRIRQAMSLIEHEWQHSEEKVARRLYVEIGLQYLRTYR